MMKSNKLLDIWNKYLVIDPKPGSVKDDLGKELSEKLSKLGNLYEVLHSIIENSVRSVSDYFTNPFPSSPYFEPISGHKTFIVPDEYFGVLDLWFPNEVYLFDIARNPILAIYILESLKSKFSCSISDISKVYCGRDELVVGTLGPDIIDTIKDQEYWAFYLGDPGNNLRERALKIRQIEVTDVKFPHIMCYRTFLNITAKDLKTGETIYPSNGWSIYLSREILESRLTDLENLWLRYWDNKVGVLDSKIKNKKYELENLKTERARYLNSLDDYRKKIKKIIWKNF